MTRTNHVSASSIASFKKCPQAFRLAYVEGIRQEHDADVLRTGSSWHGMHEAYAGPSAHALRVSAEIRAEHPQYIHGDPHDAANAYGMDAAVAYLNQRYAECPPWVEIADWQLERQILLVSFTGYIWYWQNDPIAVLATELPFDLPLHEPTTGMPCSTKSVVRVGKIDQIGRWHGAIVAVERKSTSKSVEPDSDFWTRWAKDTQISTYALALRDMQEAGLLPFTVPTGERFGSTLIDVWSKPKTKPAMLTQKDTAAFIESGEYCGTKFEVEAPTHTGHSDGDVTAVDVNSQRVEMVPGKKGFAIRESVEMYGARLLADIYEQPHRYFARREISRTADEIRDFRRELFAIYQAQSIFQKSGCWFHNESACDTPYRCDYKSICFGAGADEACAGVGAPLGFKRLPYADFRVNGESVSVE